MSRAFLYSGDPMSYSNNYSPSQPASSQFYQPTATSYGKYIRDYFQNCFTSINIVRVDPTSTANAYVGDYAMPHSQPVTSQNAFFSPQTAFYAPKTIPSNSSMSNVDFLSNNPLLNVGFNVVEQGMKDFTGRTVNILPNEVTIR
jgi:hypothetical protein